MKEFCRCPEPQWTIYQNTMGGKPHPTNPTTRNCEICGRDEETELDRTWAAYDFLTTRNGDFR